MGVGEGLAANQSGSPPAILPRSPDSRVKAGIYRNPARSRPRFKLQPVGFLRSRQFSPDSIREKRLPKQGKIAEDYSKTTGARSIPRLVPSPESFDNWRRQTVYSSSLLVRFSNELIDRIEFVAFHFFLA